MTERYALCAIVTGGGEVWRWKRLPVACRGRCLAGGKGAGAGGGGGGGDWTHWSRPNAGVGPFYHARGRVRVGVGVGVGIGVRARTRTRLRVPLYGVACLVILLSPILFHTVLVRTILYMYLYSSLQSSPLVLVLLGGLCPDLIPIIAHGSQDCLDKMLP